MGILTTIGRICRKGKKHMLKSGQSPSLLGVDLHSFDICLKTCIK